MSDRDNITLPREVVKEAADALEDFVYHGESEGWWQVVKALRTALAAEQPKQEPKVTLNPDAMRTVSSGDAAFRAHLAAAQAAMRLEVTADPRLTPEQAAAILLALAAEQPKQEPVAWRPRLSPNLCFHWSRPWNEGVPSEQTVDYWSQKGAGVEYAYAAPPDAEALRLDAERYRWMATGDTRRRVCNILPLFNAYAYRKERIDAAIDAAMKGDKT